MFFQFIFLGGMSALVTNGILAAVLFRKGTLAFFLKKWLRPQFLEGIVEESELQAELTPVISDQIDKVLEIFKARHSMIGMFLSPEMAKSFKATGVEEAMHLIPVLVEKGTKRLCQEKTIERIENSLRASLKSMLPQVLAYSFGIGALVGGLLGLFF